MPPPDFNILLARGRAFFSAYTENLLAIYAEKGFAPFKKTVAISAPALLILYIVGYMPLGDKIINAKYKLENYSVVAQSAGEYTETRDRLSLLQAKLPSYKEKEDWLGGLLSSSIKPFGLAFDQLSPQTDVVSGNYVLVSRTAELTATYDVIGRWIADLETTPKLLRIVSFELVRDPGNPLQVKVSITLSTIFAKPSQSGGGV